MFNKIRNWFVVIVFLATTLICSAGFTPTNNNNTMPQFFNFAQESYLPMVATSPWSMSGISAWNTFASNSVDTWGIDTNSYYYLTNMVAYVSNNSLAPLIHNFIGTDNDILSTRNANGQWQFNPNIFRGGTPGDPTHILNLMSNIGMTYLFYTSFGNYTAGGNAGSGIAHIYQDTLWVCTNHAGMLIEDDVYDANNANHTTPDAVANIQWHKTFFRLMNQAVHDYNVYASANFLPTWIPPVITSALYYSNSLNTGAVYSAIDQECYKSSGCTLAGNFSGSFGNNLLQFLLIPGNLTQPNHYIAQNSMYGVDTNIVDLSFLGCTPFIYRFGYFADPAFLTPGPDGIYTLTNYVFNPWAMATFNGGATVGPSQVYSNNNTWVFQRPLQGNMAGTTLIGLINSNNVTSNFTINCGQFGLSSNVLYDWVELFSQSPISTASWTMSFTVPSTSLNLFEVKPHTLSPSFNYANQSFSFGASAADYANGTGQYSISLADYAGHSAKNANRNTYIGNGAGYLSTGDSNTGVGNNSLNGNGTGGGGQGNSGFGENAGLSITTGQNNTFLGDGAGYHVTGGGNNVIISGSGGSSGIVNGNYNIDIESDAPSDESYTIRLGTPGTHTTAYIAGSITGNGGGLTNLQGNGAAFTNLPIVPANNSVSYLAYSNLASWGNSLIKGTGQGNITTNGSTGITATNFGWLKYWASSSSGNDLPTLANNTIFTVSSGNIRSGSNGTVAFGTIKNIEGGINDAANGSFNIAYFKNVLTAAAADLVLHPNLDSTQATTGTGIRFDLYDLYNNGTYVSPNGKMYGTLTGTHFNYNGYAIGGSSSEYGLWSSNQTDSISWTNVIGPSFYAFYMMGTGSMSAGGCNIGTNVYYVNGVSNCTVPCNVASYSVSAWSYGVQVFTNLPYGPNIITCSNYTACAVGYSGTNMTAMTFAWGACPAQFQWIDPIYIWGTHYPTSTSYNTNFIASQNVAQQQVAALLKSTGIPAAYVSSAAIGTNISPDSLHPSDQGYTNFANVLIAAIAANSAWAGVYPLPHLLTYNASLTVTSNLTVNGTNFSTNFVGNGSGLTNVTAANVASGAQATNLTLNGTTTLPSGSTLSAPNSTLSVSNVTVNNNLSVASNANFQGTFQGNGTNATAGQVWTATDSSGHAAFAPAAAGGSGVQTPWTNTVDAHTTNSLTNLQALYGTNNSGSWSITEGSGFTQFTTKDTASTFEFGVPGNPTNANVTANTFTGFAFQGGSFTGNGSAVTSLNASQLTSGQVPAAAATNYAQLSGATNNWTAATSNVFSGGIQAGNSSNTISGTFTGNGGGLTNVPALPKYYLAQTGNDNNSGLSSNTAFATLAKACAIISSNKSGEIIVEPGLYTNMQLNLAGISTLNMHADPTSYGRVKFLCTSNTFTNWTLYSGSTYSVPATADLTNLVNTYCTGCGGAGPLGYNPFIFLWNYAEGTYSIDTFPANMATYYPTNWLEHYRLTNVPNNALASLSAHAAWAVTNGNLYVVFPDGGSGSGRTVFAPSTNYIFITNANNCTITMQGIEVYFYCAGFDVTSMANFTAQNDIAYGCYQDGFDTYGTLNGTNVMGNGVYTFDHCWAVANENQGITLGIQNPIPSGLPMPTFITRNCYWSFNQRHGFVSHGITCSCIGDAVFNNGYLGFSCYSGAKGNAIGCTSISNYVGYYCNAAPGQDYWHVGRWDLTACKSIGDSNSLMTYDDNEFIKATGCELSSSQYASYVNGAGSFTNCGITEVGCYSRTRQLPDASGAGAANVYCTNQVYITSGNITASSPLILGLSSSITALPNGSTKAGIYDSSYFNGGGGQLVFDCENLYGTPGWYGTENGQVYWQMQCYFGTNVNFIIGGTNIASGGFWSPANAPFTGNGSGLTNVTALHSAPNILATNVSGPFTNVNNSGYPQMFSTSVKLTTASVAGDASVQVFSTGLGGSTNTAAISTTGVSLAMTYTNHLSVWVTNGGSYGLVTNLTSGAGNAASPVANTGQLITY